jgi:hypothetical protein
MQARAARATIVKSIGLINSDWSNKHIGAHNNGSGFPFGFMAGNPWLK